MGDRSNTLQHWNPSFRKIRRAAHIVIERRARARPVLVVDGRPVGEPGAPPPETARRHDHRVAAGDDREVDAGQRALREHDHGRRVVDDDAVLRRRRRVIVDVEQSDDRRSRPDEVVSGDEEQHSAVFRHEERHRVVDVVVVDDRQTVAELARRQDGTMVQRVCLDWKVHCLIMIDGQVDIFCG